MLIYKRVKKCVYLFVELPIDTAGCTIPSDCATPGALCSSGTCQCPDIQFYNGSMCVFSKFYFVLYMVFKVRKGSLRHQWTRKTQISLQSDHCFRYLHKNQCLL